MFRQETRALDGLCIAGCSRSLPLPVPYLSTHGCRTVCLRGFGGRFFSGSEMQRCTNTEPGAATGYSVDYEPRCFVRRLAHWTVCVLQVGSGRYHHPSRAARLGTPVRSRFRICRPTLAKSLVTPRVLKSICSAQVAAGRYRECVKTPDVSGVFTRSLSLPVPYSSTHDARLFASLPDICVVVESVERHSLNQISATMNLPTCSCSKVSPYSSSASSAGRRRRE